MCSSDDTPILHCIQEQTSGSVSPGSSDGRSGRMASVSTECAMRTIVKISFKMLHSEGCFNLFQGK